MAWVVICGVHDDRRLCEGRCYDLNDYLSDYLRDSAQEYDLADEVPLYADCADKPIIRGRDFVILVQLRENAEKSALRNVQSRCCINRNNQTKVHILCVEMEVKRTTPKETGEEKKTNEDILPASALAHLAHQIAAHIPLHEIAKKKVEIKVPEQNSGGERCNNPGSHDALRQLQQWFAGFFMAYRYRIRFS